MVWLDYRAGDCVRVCVGELDMNRLTNLSFYGILLSDSVRALNDEAPNSSRFDPHRIRCTHTGDASSLGLFAFPSPMQIMDGITSRATALVVPQERLGRQRGRIAEREWGRKSKVCYCQATDGSEGNVVKVSESIKDWDELCLCSGITKGNTSEVSYER